MEDRLKNLVEANSEGNRLWWAEEWRRRGGKVVGVLTPDVPEEIIYATGMLPWRVAGTWRANVPRARVYCPSDICLHCSHVLESLLSGELDFLDGVVATNWSDDHKRLWDIWAHLGKTPFVSIMHVPHELTDLAVHQLAKEMRRLVGALEQYGGREITENTLRESIRVHNRMRGLLLEVYELRKRDVPALSGTETLGLVTAAMVMPKDTFIQELEALLPYLKERKASLRSFHPRILLSGDLLDHPGYVRVMEEEGCVVAMDDLDTGSRYFWGDVDAGLPDPVFALARRYLSRPGPPRMLSWDQQFRQVIEWAGQFRIDGVVELCLMYSRAREMRAPLLAASLEGAGIPAISIKREYHLANEGQLRTRVGAFVEMLEAQGQANGVRR